MSKIDILHDKFSGKYNSFVVGNFKVNDTPTMFLNLTDMTNYVPKDETPPPVAGSETTSAQAAAWISDPNNQQAVSESVSALANLFGSMRQSGKTNLPTPVTLSNGSVLKTVAQAETYLGMMKSHFAAWEAMAAKGQPIPEAMASTLMADYNLVLSALGVGELPIGDKSGSNKSGSKMKPYLIWGGVVLAVLGITFAILKYKKII
ncbi:MAG: hypothetical protein WCT77_00205 [Bacteroidota bacterium]|jgi:hypothetical protein